MKANMCSYGKLRRVAASDEEISALYGLSLAEFTPARNALAKQARAAGEIERAEQITRLRKPTLVAWTLNMLPRLRAAELAELLEAGEQAEAAQARLLAAGGDAADLRDARQRLHRLARALAGDAGEILVKGGRAAREQTLLRTAQALEACAVSAEGRRQLQEGAFAEEPQSPGFDVLAQLSASRMGGTGAKPMRGRQSDQVAPARERARARRSAERAVEAARGELEARQAARREAVATRRDAEKLARAREREAALARQRVEEVRKRAERAEQAEVEAKRRLDEAREQLDRL